MENDKLLKRANAGDQKSKDQFIALNSGLVWSIVQRFLNRGYEKEDLFQIGCIGLMKAIDHFDFTYHVAFSTYAVPKIMGEIKRFLRDDSLVKISRRVKENQLKIEAFRQNHITVFGRDPTMEEVEQSCHIKKEDIVYAMEAKKQMLSLDADTTDDNPYRMNLERLSANNSFEQELLNKILLEQAMQNLTHMERELVRLRYYENKTQQQTGQILGMTQVQVSRMEKKIIAGLKNIIKGKIVAKHAVVQDV